MLTEAQYAALKTGDRVAMMPIDKAPADTGTVIGREENGTVLVSWDKDPAAEGVVSDILLHAFTLIN